MSFIKSLLSAPPPHPLSTVFTHLLLFTKSEEIGAGVEFQLLPIIMNSNSLTPINIFDVIKKICKKNANYKSVETKLSLVAQLVKNLPAMQETLVQFMGQEDPLEKG